MSYLERDVPAPVRPLVQAIWSHRVDEVDRSAHPILPDGCIDILFERESGELKVVGTMSKTVWQQGCGPRRYFGIRFRPGAFCTLINDRVDQLTDQVLDAEVVLGNRATDLREKLNSPRADLYGVFTGWLRAHNARHRRAVDPRLACALRLMLSGRMGVSQASDIVGLSRQRLRTLFLEQTGLAPKAFARAMRVAQAAELIGQTRTSLAAISMQAGYADQAHLSREFARVVGVSPARFRAGQHP